jgi:S-adenosyl methyltransferase
MADSYGALDPGSAAPPREIDVTKPHPARMYDYFLGGKDNFAADRAPAAQVLDSWGGVRTAVRENRAFGDLAFTGLKLVDPGVVLVSERRPEADAIRPLPSEVNTYGGVARKP